MYCILVFDSLNDIIYKQYDENALLHIKHLGIEQGLVSADLDGGHRTISDDKLSANLIMQLFSPIVTSQRVMAVQFGNSYTSIQCHGVNLVFDEYMGFLFLHIGMDKISTMKRTISVCISLVRHLCGPDVEELKHNIILSELLASLLDKWHEIRLRDQAFFIEALEQLAVNGDITTAALTSLQEACSMLKTSLNYSRSHGVLLVQEKLLALYSSRETDDLIPSDLIFLDLLANIHKNMPTDSRSDSDTATEATDITHNGRSHDIASPSKNIELGLEPAADSMLWNSVKSNIIFLKGKKGYRPHAVHVTTIARGMYFILIYQTSSESLCSGLFDAFSSLTNFQKVLGSETDQEIEKKTFESLESAFKRIADSLKKNKNSLKEVEGMTKLLMNKWDMLRKKYTEYVKGGEQLVGGLGIPATTSNLLASLRDLFQTICHGSVDLKKSKPVVLQIAEKVHLGLNDFSDFLMAKAYRNFSLRSRVLLSINKYLEEFPGLVHFLYVDRSDHRLTAPSIDFSSEETNNLTKTKIWEMIEFGRRHLEDGHLAFMWKDTTFNYAYYLWFEDSQGSAIKPKVSPAAIIKTLPIPGILGEDFYQRLIEACFPKMNPQKIHCFELYCIHLGLATSSCVLDQSRRIAATVWEVTGRPRNVSDLL